MIEALAIVSGVSGLAAIVLVAILAFKLAAAWSVVADARVDSATKAGQIAIASADIATWKNRADDEKRRADALDDELSKAWENADPGLARERVLARWQLTRAKAPDRGGPDGVPPAPPTGTAGPVEDLGASRL